MHLKRWITGLAALPFLIWLISKGGCFVFAAVISIVSVVALREYFKIVLYSTNRQRTSFIPLLSYLIGLIIIWAVYRKFTDIVTALIAFNLVVSGMISLFKFRADKDAPWLVAKQLMGLIYIPLFLSYLVFIRNGQDGILWIYYLLIVVFAGDVGALYAGSFLGKHKLCPAVSPGKTIEGSAGGLITNLAAGALFKYFFLPEYPWKLSILFIISVGIAGQIGDLFESELKRSAGIKDSGGILPGHGGILDRIDALLFAAPVAWYFKEYLF
ncbi:MAG: phosphatidate cytidylyltransferase [Desulfobacteraceae bacterium]|nr:MAG: phosphatidate cytidylyltransferase [Desulfobacteraceae bacterium]